MALLCVCLNHLQSDLHTFSGYFHRSMPLVQELSLEDLLILSVLLMDSLGAFCAKASAKISVCFNKFLSGINIFSLLKMLI